MVSPELVAVVIIVSGQPAVTVGDGSQPAIGGIIGAEDFAGGGGAKSPSAVIAIETHGHFIVQLITFLVIV